MKDCFHIEALLLLRTAAQGITQGPGCAQRAGPTCGLTFLVPALLTWKEQETMLTEHVL